MIFNDFKETLEDINESNRALFENSLEQMKKTNPYIFDNEMFDNWKSYFERNTSQYWNNVELFKVTNGEKKIGNALKLLNKAVYNIDKCNHVKNRLSCYGKYGVCEYYKTKHCS